jgi:hypothetical protein
MFDTDGLAASLKNYRDALKDMRIIDDDRPSSGHVFVYTQEISRGKDAKRGVMVSVAPRCGVPEDPAPTLNGGGMNQQVHDVAQALGLQGALESKIVEAWVRIIDPEDAASGKVQVIRGTYVRFGPPAKC